MFSEQITSFIAAHPILSLSFVAITFALIANEIANLRKGYKSLTPALLTHLINRENALVIDVSPINDFEKGHIVGSRNIVLSQLDPEGKVLAKAKESESPIVLVCRTGMVSAQAAAKLVKAGFTKVHWLDGGIAAWQSADLPLAKGK